MPLNPWDLDPILWAFSVMLTVIVILGILEKLMPGEDEEK